MTEKSEIATGDGGVKLVYILYLVGLVTGWLTGIVGVVVAYVNRAEAEPWLATHYHYQIRTFWIGLLFAVITGVLSVVVIGLLLIPLVAIWLIVRCVKGFMAADRGEPIPDPYTWLF